MSQPSARDIDAFRMKFYEQMIADEQKKEREILRKQKTCYHRYEPFALLPNGTMEWICSRCDHVTRRRM